MSIDGYEVTKRQVNADCPARRVIATLVRADACPVCSKLHVGGLVLEDGSCIEEDDAVALVDAGATFFMVAPDGSSIRHADHQFQLSSVFEHRLMVLWHSGPYTRELENQALEQADLQVGPCQCGCQRSIPRASVVHRAVRR